MSSPNARPYLLSADHSERLESGNRLVPFLDGCLVSAFCLLLTFGPLAFGAVQPWAICTLELGASFCVVLWLGRELARGRPVVCDNALFLPAAVFGLLIGIQLLTGRTAYWYATWQNALLWAAYGMILFIATQCLRRPISVRNVGIFLVTFGFLVALFAMVQQFTWNGYLYWFVPNRYGGMVYGPYVNHSHYAGLMEMLVPLPLIFAMMTHSPKALRVLFAFVGLIMASTIFLSRSLGGMFAFAAQMIVLGLIVFFRERSRFPVLLLLVMMVLLAAGLVLLSPGGISERIGRLQDPLAQSGAGDRLAILRDSLKMIEARPILGWGFGTFPEVYPSFRSFYTNFFVNEAHNDYIQLAVETGLVGFAIACWFIALIFRKCLRRTIHWRTDICSAATLAAMIGVTGILVHSLADFNLQIPANAALFFALTAVATTSPHFCRSDPRTMQQ